MNSISFENLEKNLDEVIDNHQPVIISHKNDKKVILINLEDFSSYNETVYSIKELINAERLQQSITQVEADSTISNEPMEK